MNLSAASEWARRRSTALSVALLAALAYLPSLTAAPGRMPADSKLYVYLDPGRFLGDAATTLDPRQFGSWVPHQHIAYLWPTGPWYWVFERLGVPDWVAQRLWIGTLLLAAGLGVRWMSRLLGLTATAAVVAAVVYQLSPYVLPYISRTSVLLLPWAGLGWIVGCTALAAARGRWRYPAVVALIVLTVGAVNATALAMIIPAPVLWLLHVAWRGDVTWKRALTTAAKIAGLSLAVSTWWIVMLVIQARRGADVLVYSESLESVSFTSTSTEVLRGLGYWLFYLRDAFGATTTASLDHLVSLRVIAAGFAIVAVALAGITVTNWAHRRFAAMLVGFGLVLGVGVHPIDDPSPLMSLLIGDGDGGLALALRSSTRAVPVLVLGLALGAGAIVAACGSVRPRIGAHAPTISVARVAAALLVLLTIANLPALFNGGFVDPNLERDPEPPEAWIDAAEALDAAERGYRLLALPGTEFGAYRWGYTVDQPLPALTERALLTRDLLPLGSPAAMDLVFALDDRFQDGTADAAGVAPIARLLGVDTVWVTGDVDAARFRLARPEVVDDLLTGSGAESADLLAPTRFGAPQVMRNEVPWIDETSVGDPLVGSPIAPVTLVPIADPLPTVRVKSTEIVVSGDGAGLVDAAAAGVIDGRELIRYSATLDGDDLDDALARASRLVVTDGNRDRAHHWRSSQDVTGFTESGGPDTDGLRPQPADQRLPVFEHDDPASQTVSIQDGPVSATASAYGEPFAYLPEHRAVMAIDGDVTTAWTVADRAPAAGESITLVTSDAIDRVTLRQPDTAPGARRITAVDVEVGDRRPLRVELGDDSLRGAGQTVAIERSDGPTNVTITIVATDEPQPPIAEAIGGVGFAEIDVGLGPTTEWIRVPVDALAHTSDAPDTPMSIVLARLRTDPADRWRSDPEPSLRRQIDLERAASFDVAITLRLDARAEPGDLAAMLDEPAFADAHLTGTPTARGAAAFDDDAGTAWITPFGNPVGDSVTLSASGSAATVGVELLAGDHSPVTQLRLTDTAGSFVIDVPGDPAADVELPRPVDLDELRIAIEAVEAVTTLDRRFAEPFVLPAAIAEIRFDGRSPSIAPKPTIAGDCRDDLLSLDGLPIALSFEAPVERALAGDPIEATVCDGPIELDPGTHRIASTAAASTGLHVDAVTLVEPSDPARAGAAPAATAPTSVRGDVRDRSIEVPACPDGCWLVVGDGLNEGWTASVDGASLGAPELVDGNANGWFLPPSPTSTTVQVQWTAQRPLDVAFLFTLLAVATASVIVAIDRRRDDDPDPSTAQPPRVASWSEEPDTLRAVAAVALGVLVAAVLIGWTWGVVALVAGLPAIIARRARVVGVVGLGLVLFTSGAVLWIVRDDRPFPNAGWPVRFEWLHGWTLLGVLMVMVSVLAARRDQPS